MKFFFNFLFVYNIITHIILPRAKLTLHDQICSASSSFNFIRFTQSYVYPFIWYFITISTFHLTINIRH